MKQLQSTTMHRTQTTTRARTSRAKTNAPSRSLRLFMLLAFGFLLVPACSRPAVRPQARRRDSNAEVANPRNSDFRVAFDFLDNFHQFDPTEVGQRITYHLQRWVSSQQPDPDWIEDPLIKRLPKRFSSTQADGFLSKLRFDKSAFDVLILREAIWTRDLALQIDKAALHDRQFRDWLAANDAGIKEESLEELTTAAKIFDWTVRNIQLEKLPYATAPVDEHGRETLVPKDGAMYLPAEALMVGRGDWIARARVANLIARQAGLATVVLAVESESGVESPWCWAVLIEEQLYLFDFRLGLPVPGDAGQGVSTLSAVIDKPELLRQLDLEADDYGRARTYPVDKEDLKRIVALMDSSPESLSQRMKLLERQLTGERRLALTTSPSRFAVDLRNCRGVTGARLWVIPFEVYHFRQDVNEIRRNVPPGEPAPIVPEPMDRMKKEMEIVDGTGRLSLPRRQHFRGNYSNTENEDGAKTAYMACRTPDSVINRDIDLEVMYEQGLIPALPPDEITRRQVVDALRQRMRTSKQYASFWLGLIAFEEGKYDVAINYLDKRVLSVDKDGPWTELATYNLARAYEQLGLESDDDEKLAKSRELLRSLKRAPQATGNRIRASRE